MAMNVGGAGGDDEPMMEINTTPLIDVLLVLLVMLIITIPLQTHAVKLDMPQSVTEATPPEESAVVQLMVDAGGAAFWNGEELPDIAALEARFLASVGGIQDPEIHFRPDRNVEYDYVAKILSAAQRAGVVKIGFVGNEQYME